jgi:UDP-N-acetylglucosamine--N-acetylmuramyl-(pentapeptide) pyrophosphoryl-undecaprenol N-acetylglucosamine transferase
MLELLDDASIVVCHAGSGSLIPALQAGCRIVAMPRDPACGEHFDAHQEEICTAFSERGLIEVARTVEELGPAIARARLRTPIVATSDTEPLRSHLKMLVERWYGAGEHTPAVMLEREGQPA